MALIDDILSEEYYESMELEGEQYLRKFNDTPNGPVYGGTYQVLFFTEIDGVGYTLIQKVLAEDFSSEIGSGYSRGDDEDSFIVGSVRCSGDRIYLGEAREAVIDEVIRRYNG